MGWSRLPLACRISQDGCYFISKSTVSLLPSPCRATALSAARRLDTFDLEMELDSIYAQKVYRELWVTCVLKLPECSLFEVLARQGKRGVFFARLSVVNSINYFVAFFAIQSALNYT